MPLFKKILSKLIRYNISVSTAESCTGGLLAYSFTKNKDSSKIFKGGYIAYSNQFKIKNLNVKNISLKKFGAASSEIAREMAKGLYLKNKTDICISTTGIAGPGGASKKKPIGLVYIGIHFNSKTRVFKKNFTGNRTKIQKECVRFIFNFLEDLI